MEEEKEAVNSFNRAFSSEERIYFMAGR